MGLWALHYVRSEKMIKMEVSKDKSEENIDNKRKRKDIGPHLQITTAAISMFLGYLKSVHTI